MGAFSGAVCAVAGSLLIALASAASAQDLREVPIGLSSMTFAAAPPRIAEQMGLFARHGLAPKFTTLDSGSGATTALISGSVEAIVGGPGEHVAAAARGQDIVAIANLYQGLGGSLVLSKEVVDRIGVAPDAPAAERLAALDGLLIGSSSATSSYTVAVKSAAEAAGAEVRFAYMPQTTTPGATETGTLDGFMASAPIWSVLVERGTGVLWLSGPGGDFPAEYSPASSTSIQMMRAKAEANPELANALAATFADFVAALEEHPDDVRQAVAELYPEIAPATLDLLLANEAQGWMAKPLTPEDMAHEIAFVKTAGASLPGVDSVDPAGMLYP